ncbi:terminase small subunit [Lactobacillus amylolyticus]|uniref:terminase small subunit n=1 Tax=Lactobacillus amylolyticus TaxID=83683 RepID=UPI002491B457|nr:terminase small subunit [Lactobacillus amylolyticus]
MKGKQLTEKQKAFADKYIETGNATEAYKSAYSTKRMSGKSVNTEAKRTLRKPSVHDYIDKRMKKLEDAKIPKLKEILEFLGRVMRGKEKSIVVTNQGIVKAPPKMKDRMSAAKELLKRYPTTDPLMEAQLRKLNAEATLAESKTNESEDKTGKLMRFMDKQSDESLRKLVENIEKGENDGS